MGIRFRGRSVVRNEEFNDEDNTDEEDGIGRWEEPGIAGLLRLL